jgi:hypothetical protein
MRLSEAPPFSVPAISMALLPEFKDLSAMVEKRRKKVCALTQISISSELGLRQKAEIDVH